MIFAGDVAGSLKCWPTGRNVIIQNVTGLFRRSTGSHGFKPSTQETNLSGILKTLILALPLVGLGACTTSPQANHEMACVGGTLTGAVIGGAIGNRFGGGRGKTLATSAGAAAGAVTAATQMNC